LVLLLAAAWGCAAQRALHAVSLHYEGPEAPRLFAPSAASPAIVVAPFVDLRKDKERVGLYQWHNMTFDLITKPGTPAEAVTGMARDFLQKAGLRPRAGAWDGEVESLARVEADYAIYGEILSLDFTGRGTLPDAKNRGVVVIEVRLGSRKERQVVRRSVEVAPDEFQFILFDNQYQHLAHIESIIRRSVSRAIREALADLLRRLPS